MGKATTPIDRSLAFTALLEQDWYRDMDNREAEEVTTKFLEDWYAAEDAKDMFAFSQTWTPPAPEKSDPAASPFRSDTPEHRVFEAARVDHGLTDEQVLKAAGWVEHDGTDLRAELIELYRNQPGPKSFEDGLRAHAQSWAWHGMRSDLETAEAYAEHMAGLHRSGEMTTWTSHRDTYPEFLAEHDKEVELS
jgi:hypothetical protein